MYIKKNKKNRHFKKLFKSRHAQKVQFESLASSDLSCPKYSNIRSKSSQLHSIFIYITTKNEEEALLISSSLIKFKLIACANILPAIMSVFYWENAIQKTQETALIVKTTKDKFNQVCKTVMDLHSYTCPCIVALPIIAGNNDFLQWVHNTTHPLT